MSAAVPNHRRTKPGGIKPGAANSGVTGPTSQIPGLCQSATDSAAVERSTGRRVGIFETDSEYVKLAKQGGHKGKLMNLSFYLIDQFKSNSNFPAAFVSLPKCKLIK
ncbi:hypothetical protein CHARACLAT_016727 [Characodon lateralis]|uniref:Uncharacterized protein n=1 Tax=Characodon lateralis TaxID=208331 RepID=A0ABU7CR51_9TELE|nr:hypothetical protein [Characodon lateralis]